MNSSTGHITTEVTPSKGYELLPRWLRKEAERELAGRKEAHIDLDADTPLAHYARARRMKAEERRAMRAAKRLAQR